MLFPPIYQNSPPPPPPGEGGRVILKIIHPCFNSNLTFSSFLNESVETTPKRTPNSSRYIPDQTLITPHPETNFSKKDAPESKLSKKDGPETDLSQKDGPEASLSQKDDSETNFSKKDDPETNLSQKNDPETNLSQKDDPETNSSEKNGLIETTPILKREMKPGRCSIYSVVKFLLAFKFIQQLYCTVVQCTALHGVLNKCKTLFNFNNCPIISGKTLKRRISWNLPNSQKQRISEPILDPQPVKPGSNPESLDETESPLSKTLQDKLENSTIIRKYLTPELVKKSRSQVSYFWKLRIIFIKGPKHIYLSDSTVKE